MFLTAIIRTSTRYQVYIRHRVLISAFRKDTPKTSTPKQQRFDSTTFRLPTTDSTFSAALQHSSHTALQLVAKAAARFRGVRSLPWLRGQAIHPPPLRSFSNRLVLLFSHDPHFSFRRRAPAQPLRTDVPPTVVHRKFPHGRIDDKIPYGTWLRLEARYFTRYLVHNRGHRSEQTSFVLCTDERCFIFPKFLQFHVDTQVGGFQKRMFLFIVWWSSSGQELKYRLFE